MNLLIVASLLLNTILFGIIALRSDKTKAIGISVPKFLKSNLFEFPISMGYLASLAIILFAFDNIILGAVGAIAMHFVINHLIWGIIIGIIASIIARKERTPGEIESKK